MAAPQTPPYPSAPPDIVLIESETMLRLTMSKFLGRSGYRVTACPDVRSAVGMLARRALAPALIVLAARKMDEDVAAAPQRLFEVAPGAPILGVVDTVDTAAPQVRTPGNLRLLAPPFDIPDVLRAIGSYLRHAGYRLPEPELLEA
ncbi:MAG TPA: hypothetical protein VMY76_17005 [Gemmatimonadales bacterium]|nr:hypothetical protein [Gemmatimonadales bacterium]